VGIHRCTLSPGPSPARGRGEQWSGLKCAPRPARSGVEPPLLPVAVQIGIDGLVQGASGLDARDQVAFAQQGLASYPAN